MTWPQNLTEYQLSAIPLPEPDDRFDQELVEWFALHRGVWSGTAAELLAAVKTRVDVDNDLWPQSPRALYAHMESHGQILRSLGVDVLLRNGYPRMLSLRLCQDEKPAPKPPSGTSRIDRTSDPPTSLPPLADHQKTNPVDSGEMSSAASQRFSQDIPISKSDLADHFVSGKFADGDNFEGRLFYNTEEALFAIVEMRGQIREQSLDFKSAIHLVVGRTQEITRSIGVAVGLLQQDSVVYPARAGIAATIAGLHFQSNFFQSCLQTGEVVQLQDAQRHPRVGATCRREGIGSLIIVPIFHNQRVAGAMGILFKERRSFSTGDVMDAELIAGVLSEALSGAAQIELKPAEGRECAANRKASENIELLQRSLNEKLGLIDRLPSPFQDAVNPETSLKKSAAPESMVLSLLASKLATAPPLLWRAFRRAWKSRVCAI